MCKREAKSSVTPCPFRKSSLSVLVISESDGASIKNATVKLSGPTPGSKPSDNSGFAIFEDIKPGDYEVSTQLPGNMTDDFEDIENVLRTVSPGSNRSTMVKAAPKPTLLVIVRDAKGREQDSDFYQYAKVSVTGDSDLGTIETNERGEADFGKVAAGNYFIEIKPHDNDLEFFQKIPLKEVSVKSGAASKTEFQLEAVIDKEWGINHLEIQCGIKKSKDEAQKVDNFADKDTQGFHFLPIKDTAKVRWQLENPEQATTLTLTLYSATRGDAPIWQKEFTADEVKSLEFANWDGTLPSSELKDAASFPDNVLTVEHSPYALCAEAGDGAQQDIKQRWTYFEIKISKIELLFAGKDLIPNTPIQDVDNTHVAKTTLLENSINDTLQAAVPNLLAPTDQLDIDLKCNYFTTWSWDMYEHKPGRKSTAFIKHKARWGQGPRIPIEARIWLLQADDNEVHGGSSSAVIGKTKFYWDWDSKDEIANLPASLDARVNTFLTNTLDYKRQDAKGPPNSTNCHIEHGGKRGSDNLIFPETSTANFPFVVKRCATRKWASYSLASLTGNEAGKTGAIFQPSRIAGDNYILTVYAGVNKVNIECTDNSLALQNKYANFPHAKTGQFTVFKEIDVFYARKAPVVQTAVKASISAEYKKCYFKVNFSANQAADETRLQNNYDAYIQRVLTGQMTNEAGNVAVPQPHISNNQRPYFAFLENTTYFDSGTPAGTPHAIIAKDYAKLKQEVLVESTREYVTQKARKINTPRKRYNAHNPPLNAGNDTNYLLNFYNNLSNTKKRKVDAIVAQKAQQRSIPDNPATYEDTLSGVAVTITRWVMREYSLNGAADGLSIFHCEAPMAFKMLDNSIRQPPSSTGGLGPSNATTYGGDRAIHLVYLPQTPLVGPNVKYNTPVTGVLTHEMGHNVFLCHAPDAPVNSPYLHDENDDKCLMNYDQTSDHLCGFCHMKLRGWGTIPMDNQPMEDNMVALDTDSAQNKVVP